MALNANIHAKGKYSRNDFHPLRETAPKNLADPSKIFRQLKAKENGRHVQSNLRNEESVLRS